MSKKNDWKLTIKLNGELIHSCGLPYNLQIIRGKVFKKYPRKSQKSPVVFLLSTNEGRNSGKFYKSNTFHCVAWGEIAEKIENNFELNDWIDCLAHFDDEKVNGHYQSEFKVFKILTPESNTPSIKSMDREDYVGTDELPY